MLKFHHPSTFLLCGPTGSGKTQWLAEVLRFDYINPTPERIVWIYGEWQSLYQKLSMILPNIEFIKDMNSGLYEGLDPQVRNLVVIDDQMTEAGDSKDLCKFFTKGSHHRNLSVVYIVQNLFDKGRSQRTVSLNTQYMILFKNPRDQGQIDALGRQMYPNTKRFLSSVFADATSKPYGYLVIDLRPETPDNFRLRSNVLPIDKETVVYRYKRV